MMKFSSRSRKKSSYASVLWHESKTTHGVRYAIRRVSLSQRIELTKRARELSIRNTGMVRKVDDLGRVVVPAEMRKSFGIREGDYLDISVEEDRIILSKRQDACVFCRSSEVCIRQVISKRSAT